GDHRDHGFAEVGMLDANHGALADARHLVDYALDLLGVDVEAAGDDEVLGAADDREIAVGVEPADVAGPEEAVRPELAARLLRVAPAAPEDVGAVDLEVADRARRQRLAGGADDAERDAGQRQPDAAAAPRAVERVRGQHVGLGHAVALEDDVA